ncbi:MAG: alpha/beta hydrolase [Egibacteraceae bacterium]
MRPTLVVLLVVAVLLAMAWLGQRRLIYLPSPADVPPVDEALPGARELTLTTDDGLGLEAWLASPTDGDLGVGVLVAGGNAGHRGLRAPLAEALRARGLTVLLFDYRGYAGNPGRPSEEGLLADARAARQALLGATDLEADALLYYGESIGTGVVTALATEAPPGGLVLRSPFPELADVGRRHYPFLPVRALLRDRYPLAEQLAEVTAPVTVVYGEDDGIVPPELSRQAAAAATDLHDVVAVPGGHNDRALLDGAALVDAVERLAIEIAPPASPRP